MSALYVILIQLISAVNGDVIFEYHVGTPMTLEECNAELLKQGVIPAHDGVAIVTFCDKVGGIET
jgi:hypothetical protein